MLQALVDNEKLTWQKESLEHIVDATSKERDELKEKLQKLEVKFHKFPRHTPFLTSTVFLIIIIFLPLSHKRFHHVVIKIRQLIFTTGLTDISTWESSELTTSNAVRTNGLTFLLKHGRISAVFQ
jgi:hypothetical protein